MLNSLHIENLAVIKNLDVDFTKGFMVLSGETGAGKSIIIDSINLLIGAKADKELIRTGEGSAMVSGLFSSLSDSSVLAISELGISPDEVEIYLYKERYRQTAARILKLTAEALRSVF